MFIYILTQYISIDCGWLNHIDRVELKAIVKVVNAHKLSPF